MSSALRWTLLVLALLPSRAEHATVRIGLIGAGCIGIEHLRNLRLVPDARVVAVADNHQPSLESAAACLAEQGSEAGVHFVDDYESLLALECVDAVIVATPNDHHREVLRRVAASGKHCLVEKPLCIDVAGCAEAEALAAQACERAALAGRPPPVFWCAMEYRFIPTISRLLHDARAGVVGAPRMLSIREHRFPFLTKVGDWNRFTDRTGGTLVEKCCHFFDLMRLILDDEPQMISAIGGQASRSANHCKHPRPAPPLFPHTRTHARP